jgi:L-seryl-tRNA(Ser) seleniumtransferase
VLAMLTREREDIRQACARVMPRLAQIAGPRFQADIVDCASQIGSGALPEERLPSAAVRLRPIDTGKRTGRLLSETLAEFRKLKTPVIGRIRDDAIVFDCRCLSARDESILLSAAS